jgi:hypothetical protein
MWQDTALTIINFGFIISTIPAIIKNYQLKNSRSQSLITYLSTAILLMVMAGVFETLQLYLSSISTFGSSCIWFVLSYQKIRYGKQKQG